jgi:hypothetical protein
MLLYLEQTKHARAQFQEDLTAMDPDELIPLEKSGLDEIRNHPYACAPGGTKCSARSHRLHGSPDQSHRRSQRVSAAALLPKLHPGQTVLMDNNTSFHKSTTTKTQ